jgi:hypothetical protein
MKQSKIKFYAVSLGWSYGGIMDIRIKAKEGCEISISWGDGKNITHIFRSRFAVVFSHDYFPKHITPPLSGVKFQVEISSDDPDCQIIDLHLTPMDMGAEELDVSNCPELENLTYSGYNSSWVPDTPRTIDLSRNTALKYLNCRWNGFTSLDLSHNTELEKLDCRDNRLLHLSLANNFALKKLNCSFNKMEQLFIYYAPELSEAEIEDRNNLDEATLSKIQEIIEENKRLCTKSTGVNK